uniref:TIL domain-containing protein n=1 Tax=Panagrolaimus superbus TaxID=310955 RepID=A0A914XTT1_9BILA
MICNNIPKCECDFGFFRNNQTNECVAEKDCPSQSGQECGENAALRTCPGCEPTCKNPNPICPAICRLGQACQCLQGFVRNDAGKCVKQSECAATGGNNNTQCKENETLKSCPGCEPSCKNPNPVCIQSCREGQECECSQGFVRNDAGKCVKQSECAGNNNNQCKENETLKSCPGCEPSCKNPNVSFLFLIILVLPCSF